MVLSIFTNPSSLRVLRAFAVHIAAKNCHDPYKSRHMPPDPDHKQDPVKRA